MLAAVADHEAAARWVVPPVDRHARVLVAGAERHVLGEVDLPPVEAHVVEATVARHREVVAWLARESAQLQQVVRVAVEKTWWVM